MKHFLFLLILLLGWQVAADGFMVEYQGLEWSGDLQNAQLIRIDEREIGWTYLRGTPQEHPITQARSDGVSRDYPFLEHDFFEDKWVYVFQYWNPLPLEEMQTGITCIAIPQGQNQYIFIEDNPWNWQKIRWFTQEEYLINYTLEPLFEPLETPVLQEYLGDPDLANHAYEVLHKRGEITGELVLTTLRDCNVPVSQYRIGYFFIGSLFFIHLGHLDEEEQQSFMEDAVDFLNRDHTLLLQWILRDRFGELQYQPVELYLEYCKIVFRHSRSFQEASSCFSALCNLYNQGTQLEMLWPAIKEWAFLLPEEQDFQRQGNSLEYLFDQLSFEDQQTLISFLTEELFQSQNLEDFQSLREKLRELGVSLD